MVDSIFAKGGKLGQMAGSILAGGSKRQKKKAKRNIGWAILLDAIQKKGSSLEDEIDTDVGGLMDNLNLQSKKDEFVFQDVIQPILTTEKHYSAAGGKGQLLMDESGKAKLTEDGRLQFATDENGMVLRGAGNAWFKNGLGNTKSAEAVFYNTEEGRQIRDMNGLSSLTPAGREAVNNRIQEIADNMELNHLDESNNSVFTKNKITNPIDFYQHRSYNKFLAEREGITGDPTRRNVASWALGFLGRGDEANKELQEAITKARNLSKDVDTYVEELRRPDQAALSYESIKGLFRNKVVDDRLRNESIVNVSEEIEKGEGLYTKDIVLKVFNFDPSNPFSFKADPENIATPNIEVNPFAKQNTRVFGGGGDPVSEQWGIGGTVQVRKMQTDAVGNLMLEPYTSENQRWARPSSEFSKMLHEAADRLKDTDLEKRRGGGSPEQQLIEQRGVTSTDYFLKALKLLSVEGRIQKQGDNLVLIPFSSEVTDRANRLEKEVAAARAARLDNAPLLANVVENFRNSEQKRIIETGVDKDLLPRYQSANAKDIDTVNIMFMLNPPEEYINRDIKVADSRGNERLLPLGGLRKEQADKMYASFQVKHGKSMDIENLIESIYPTPTPAPTPTPTPTPDPTPSVTNTDLSTMSEQELEEYAEKGAEEALSKSSWWADQQNQKNRETLQRYVDTGKKHTFFTSTLRRVGLPKNATVLQIQKYLDSEGAPSLLAKQ